MDEQKFSIGFFAYGKDDGPEVLVEEETDWLIKNLQDASDETRLQIWGDLERIQNRIAALITPTVLAAKETLTTADGAVRATYTDGRGSYDYEAIALDMGASISHILSYTETKVNWSQLSKDLQGSDPEKYAALKVRHYTPGNNPSVTLKLLK